MNGLNLIFKIIKNSSDSQQIVVKFSRQNSRYSIDSYREYAIDYSALDFSDTQNFISSLMNYGIPIIEEQIRNEPLLEDHVNVNHPETTNIDDYIDKITIINYDNLSKNIPSILEKIDLEI
jgi:hypothetical protein